MRQLTLEDARFNGPDYNPKFDKARLTGQIKRVYNCMSGGIWRTLREISGITNDPEASVSAQLRHLRKERFGSHIIEKKPRGERTRGLFEYRMNGQ